MNTPKTNQATKQDPISEAISILTADAASIRESHTPLCDRDDWNSEPETKAYYDRLLRVAGELSKLRAPVADERAAFEEHWRKDMNVEEMDLHRCEFPLTKYEDQPYACHETNRGWMTWQASRAALASAPVAGESLGWRVRERRSGDGKLLDCFVEAPAAPGMAYAQEVLGDDYAEAQGGIEGKLKHCQMIVAWANAAPQASEAVLAIPQGFTRCAFMGPAPQGFAGWWDWMLSPMKSGAFIRAATAEDFDLRDSSK